MTPFAALRLHALIFAALAASSTTVIAQTAPSQSHQDAARLDPDRHFLHDLADHNEAMVYLAHSAMQMKHAHMGADAAGAIDVAGDARKRDIVSILKARFRDSYEALPPPGLKAQVDSLMRLEGEAYQAGLNDFMQRHHKSAIDMIDHARLRRPEVKTLVRKIRAQHVREMNARIGMPD